MRSTLRTAVFLFSTFSILITPPGYAAPQTRVLSNQAIDARLHAATQSLQLQQTSAEYWEYGWGAFDAGTMLWSAEQASTEHNRRDRNTNIVQASESLVGLADVIFRPLPAFSASAICKHNPITDQDRLQCLALKEDLLERSADRAHEPYEIIPHLGNFGFNLIAGLIVWRVADTHHALITAIPGEIIGEIQLWTTPKAPMTDYDSYTVQFSPLLVRNDQSKTPTTGIMATYKF